MADPGISEDRLLGGRIRLLQPTTGHRAGTDAVLLAGLCGAGPGEHVVDLGAATGAVGLMVAARVEGVRLTLIERQEDLAALAAKNIALNGLADRARALGLDCFARDWPADAPVGTADLVVTNPPFFEDEAALRPSPDRGRRAAHLMAGGRLAEWVAAAARVLAPRGRIALIHRADALAAVFAALAPVFGSPRIRPIHPRAGREASRIVVHARRGGRAPLVLLPPLVLHGEGGGFTPEAAELHGGARPSPFAGEGGTAKP